jgi:hypothetical protein
MERMAQAGYKPEPEFLEQYLLPGVSLWFSGNLEQQQQQHSLQQQQQQHSLQQQQQQQRHTAGIQKVAHPLTVPQLAGLLIALARLKHKPKMNSWWVGFQDNLLQQVQLQKVPASVQPQQQQQIRPGQQQQQQPQLQQQP